MREDAPRHEWVDLKTVQGAICRHCARLAPLGWRDDERCFPTGSYDQALQSAVIDKLAAADVPEWRP